MLNVSRNNISSGWDELEHSVGLQALDASHNKLNWVQVSRGGRQWSTAPLYFRWL